MRITRYVIGSFLSLVTFYAIYLRITNQTQTQAETDSVVAAMPEAPTWREVGRRVLLDQSWEMRQPTGWWVPGTPGAENRLRQHIEGRFASSDPNVKMLVLDKANWEKFQMGYPPLAAATVFPGEPFNVRTDMRGYYLGFFRERPQTNPLTNSGGSLALALLREYEVRNPAPVRITARIILIQESLCSSAELARERGAFAGK